TARAAPGRTVAAGHTVPAVGRSARASLGRPVAGGRTVPAVVRRARAALGGAVAAGCAVPALRAGPRHSAVPGHQGPVAAAPAPRRADPSPAVAARAGCSDPDRSSQIQSPSSSPPIFARQDRIGTGPCTKPEQATAVLAPVGRRVYVSSSDGDTESAPEVTRWCHGRTCTGGR